MATDTSPLTLAEWMEKKGIDDETLARKTRTDRTTISRVRRGKRQPSWTLAAKLKRISGGLVTEESFSRAKVAA